MPPLFHFLALMPEEILRDTVSRIEFSSSPVAFHCSFRRAVIGVCYTHQVPGTRVTGGECPGLVIRLNSFFIALQI